MDPNRRKRNEMAAQRVIKGLESRNMEGYYAESKEEALKKALELIPEGSSVGWGGSMSIKEMGLLDAVCSGNYTVYNRDICKTPEEKRKTQLQIFDQRLFPLQHKRHHRGRCARERGRDGQQSVLHLLGACQCGYDRGHEQTGEECGGRCFPGKTRGSSYQCPEVWTGHTLLKDRRVRQL